MMIKEYNQLIWNKHMQVEQVKMNEEEKNNCNNVIK